MTNATVQNNIEVATPGKAMNIVLWILQILGAAMFLMTGGNKIAGNEQMIGMYEAIGIGQWFRYLTGGIEAAAAILLLIPRFSGIGALILIPTMIGAILTHLLIIGGSPVLPIILLVVMAAVAFGRRDRTLSMLLGK
jgi:uncharacterized membrane protein YphA (DoxX/SURF4 family)